MSAGVDRWRTRPRNVAIVAAGIAVVIGLVGWPRLTLYAVGTVVAVWALWFGIRKLLTERRPPADAVTVTYSATAERCCVCGSPDVVYHNYRERPFCCPCAACCEPTTDAGDSRDLTPLIGRPVKVSSPANATWHGRLIATADHPTLILDVPGAGPVVLPQTYDVQVLDERPDESGPDPDALRTDPDAAGQHTSDQGGPDPDTIRKLPERFVRALAENPQLAAEYDRVRLMLHADRDVRARLGRELVETQERLRKAERAATVLAGARRHADTTRNACLRAAERLEARAAALLDDVEDQAAFVAKAHQHDAGIWREAAAEIRAAMGAPAEGSSR